MLRKGLTQSAFVVTVGLVAATALQGCGSGLGAGFFNAAGSSASTQQAVSSPAQLGYAFSPADRTLRPIVGIVGSSRLAGSVVPAATYTAGASSSASSTALLVRADGSIDRVTLPTATIASVAGASAPANARVRFSPSGTYAVIFAPGGSSATLVAQVNTTPQVFHLTSSSALLDATVSDKGTLAVLQKQGGGSQLALISQGGSMQAVNTWSGAGAIGFLAKREDLLVADGGTNTLSLVKNISSAASLAQLSTGNLLKTPVAVGASLDGRWAVVANSADASVIRVDLTGAVAPQRLACPLQPSTVEQLAGNANFRFSEVGRSPAWLADISAQEPAMLFVPALAGL